MSYDICIQAAGVPVLSYHEDGSYQGYWFAYTADGFYTGGYGSCSGCDWREGEFAGHAGWPGAESEIGKRIDAGIGREIIKTPAMTKAQLLEAIKDMSLDEPKEFMAWLESCAE